MSLLKKKHTRRTFLRGTLGGVGVVVALPFLDCFLNDNGTALAEGTPLPVRFGTWFWGLGMDQKLFTPKKFGADYDLPVEIAAWKEIKQHVNLFSNYNVFTDGKPNFCHITGWVALRSGTTPATRESLTDPTIDVLVADAFGGGSRFGLLNCTATGSPKDTYSFRSANAINAPAVSPVDLYQRVFGIEFQDPNAPGFKPNAEIMVRKSALSAVSEQSASLLKAVGTADRARLDQYFTSVRELEQRLALQLQKPPPAPTCKVPSPITASGVAGTDTEVVAERHKLMTDTLVMAIACNQTRVFNMVYSSAILGLTKRGQPKTHHTITHEEIVDESLGAQPVHHWFLTQAQESFAYFVKALASVPEGAGSVLDNSLVYAHSDSELAKVHSLNGIPMMTAGRAGGRIKAGLHINGNGEAGTQLGYTAMKVLGLPIEDWGKGSMKTSKVISDILV